MDDRKEKQQPGRSLVFPAILGLLILITSISYSNSLQAPFVFDDIENIVENNSMHMTTITAKSLYRATFEGLNSRRLLPNLTYGLNYYFGRHEPLGYHLVNLSIHLLTAMVLFGLFFTTLTLPRLDFSRRQATEVAFIAALLWAVHPLQTNAVTYIVQRMTSMAALFYLASLLLYVRGRLAGTDGGKRYLLWGASFFCWILAMVSKENSAMLPLLIVAYELYFLKEEQGRIISGRSSLNPAGALIVVLAAGLIYVGWLNPGGILDGYRFRDFTMVERLLTESRVVIHYLSLLFLPLPSRMNLNYEIIVSRSLVAPPVTLVAIFAVLGLAWLTVYLYRSHRLLSFALLWFLANMVIESTIIQLELVFEHRMYLPATMLLLATVVLLNDLWRARPRGFRLFWAVPVIFLALCTWQRNEVWSSEVTLWRDVIKKSPGLARVYSYLGRAYNIEGRYQESHDLFQGAAGYEFKDVNFYNNWGKAAFELGKTDLAVELLERAVGIDHNHPESHYNLGVAYGSQGRVEEARREMRLGMMLQ